MARCEAAGPEEPEVYSQEYIEDCSGPRTMQMVADRSPSSKANVGQAHRSAKSTMDQATGSISARMETGS